MKMTPGAATPGVSNIKNNYALIIAGDGGKCNDK